MMHDSVLVAVRNACQSLVPLSNRSKPFVNTCARRGSVPCLPELLCARHAFAVHAKGLGVLFLVKHWHFLSSPPTPEEFHLIPF